MGFALQPGETFTVIDLFSEPAESEDNRSENQEQYAELSRRPSRATTGSSTSSSRGRPGTEPDDRRPTRLHGTHRFVHIDASHLYEHVVGDIEAARALLQPDGVVVFDDYRTVHAPGVAAAVWRETTNGLTRLFAVTPNKLYATFGDADPWLQVVKDWLDGQSFWRMDLQQVAGRELVRLQRPAPKPQPADSEPQGQHQASSADQPSRKSGWLARLTRPDPVHLVLRRLRARTYDELVDVHVGRREATQRTISAMSSATSGSATPS